jgi:hypothetical protein
VGIFNRVLIVGWGIFLTSMVLGLVFPRQVLRYGGLPAIIFGFVLGPVTFVYGIVWVVRRRVKMWRDH